MSDEQDPVSTDVPAPVIMGPHDVPLPPGMIYRDDGFFGIVGFPDDVYYDDFFTAKRIGAWVTSQTT